MRSARIATSSPDDEEEALAAIYVSEYIKQLHLRYAFRRYYK